ncbi:SAM-dependent methyltransferase [Nonomuraea dietziae]|uniref:S-adenosyl methyltransferase n=1 Tax=Nonomuraea dietziae TaxID=65515 RepID=A0A7W5V4E0_9ACTN|nr:SAM-dependent methyltransferase [Nonomuraea dietziae]MBB3725953.1 hypothetical protein [Nonomuraea dietziae]
MADEWNSAIDTSRPSIARAYDVVLNGKDNFEVDRSFVSEIVKVVPEIYDVAAYNRQVLGRGVRFLIDQGIDQFLDLGSGLPTVENTHQVAQRANPDARVVYVDNDPMVLAHGRALLAENDRTAVVTSSSTTRRRSPRPETAASADGGLRGHRRSRGRPPAAVLPVVPPSAPGAAGNSRQMALPLCRGEGTAGPVAQLLGQAVAVGR